MNSNESAYVFANENGISTPEFSGSQVQIISAAMKKICCDNCGDYIKGTPIEVEKEITINNGVEMDVPVLRYVCSEDCKNQL